MRKQRYNWSYRWNYTGYWYLLLMVMPSPEQRLRSWSWTHTVMSIVLKIYHYELMHIRHRLTAGPNTVFSDTKCAVGNSECVVGIYLMCSSIVSNEVVQLHDTRCHRLRLKCTKFDLGRGSARDHAGELTALP